MIRCNICRGWVFLPGMVWYPQPLHEWPDPDRNPWLPTPGYNINFPIFAGRVIWNGAVSLPKRNGYCLSRGGHIAFHLVQCVRPIHHQSTILLPAKALSAPSSNILWNHSNRRDDAFNFRIIKRTFNLNGISIGNRFNMSQSVGITHAVAIKGITTHTKTIFNRE